MVDARLELKIGALVHATDGPFGRVHQMILSPLQNRVVGLVKLRVSREDILKQTVFDPSQFLPVAAEAQGYKQGQALVSIHGSAGGSDELARKLEEKIDEALEESFPASDPPF